MALETGTYISDLVSTNPVSGDPKSQGDDHFRLLKSTIKATFPNVDGAVTPTDEELNYVDGVTSSIQTQLDLKAPLASPVLTGVPEAPTAPDGTNNTQIATTAFVVATSLTSSLPGQAGNDGKVIMTNGVTADWSDTLDLDIIVPAVGARIATTTGAETLTNKTATDLILADDADSTKKANFVLSGVTAGQNRSLTIEDRDTLVMTPGWVYLATVTASTSATVDIEGDFSSTYRNYVIMFDDVDLSSGGIPLLLRVKVAGSYKSGASDYHWNHFYGQNGSNLAVNSDIADDSITLASTVDGAVAYAMNGRIWLSNPSGTVQNKFISWDAYGITTIVSDAIRHVHGQGFYKTDTGAVTGIRILPSTGTIIKGNFTLFGIRG